MEQHREQYETLLDKQRKERERLVADAHAEALTMDTEVYDEVAKLESSEGSPSFKEGAKDILFLKHEAGEDIDMLLDIARVEASNGLDAEKTFVKAADVAHKIGDQDYYRRCDELGKIAETKGEIGQFSEAKEDAAKITNDGSKWRAFTSIALGEAKAGNFDDARKTIVDNIKNDYHGWQTFGSALAKLAMIEAGAGDIARARETLALITNDFNREYPYCELVTLVAEAGKFDEAEQIAIAMTDKYFQGLAYARLARYAPAHGRDPMEFLRQAEELAQQKSETGRASILHEISHTQALLGNFDTAKETAKNITGNTKYDYAMPDIALAEAEAGLFDDAEKTIGNRFSRLIPAEIKAGRIDGAENIINRFEHDQKVRIFTDLIQKGANLGEIEILLGRQRYISQKEWVGLMNLLCEKKSEMGDIDGATTIAEELLIRIEKAKEEYPDAESSWRFRLQRSADQSCKSVATALAKEGRIQEATDMAWKIVDATEKNYALIAIAEAKMKA